MDAGATAAPFSEHFALCIRHPAPQRAQNKAVRLFKSLQIPGAPHLHRIGRTKNKSVWATPQINDEDDEDEDDDDDVIMINGDRAHVRNHYSINSEISLFLTFIL